MLDAKIPKGDISEKWENHKNSIRLVSPANKKKIEIIVVGSGLAGASAASSLAALGYRVKVFCFHDTPRRAHSVAAQGGINAAKNYRNDGDSVYRLFYDMIKGGDYRSREANVYRLAEVSSHIIDQCVAQGIPFAREYGGLLDTRSFGGVQVSRTFYAKGQTGQQLLLGAYSALMRQVRLGKVKLYTRREMLDLVLIDGKARGIIVRNMLTGELERHSAHAVVLATGGYGNIYFLSTNAVNSNASAAWNAHKRGAFFANPCFTQIHPTCIPASGKYQSKLTLMSESLRNDGRVWVPRRLEDAEAIREGIKSPADIPEEDRDYFLERLYPAFGNLVPRDIASRAIKRMCDAGYSIHPGGDAVFLDFHSALEHYGTLEANRLGIHSPSEETIIRLGRRVLEAKYGNVFHMYEKITGEDPLETPMKVYPASHYTMGGLWVDYNLMTTVPGLYAIGECNFSDHGANRLGASALMQGLADGYFILPYTIGDYLADDIRTGDIPTDHPAFDRAEREVRDKIERLTKNGGRTPVDYFHRELGRVMWDKCGMVRNAKGLEEAISDIRAIREEFYREAAVPKVEGLNHELEKALRLADFLELAELMCMDALHRNESCGAHFREEYQTPDGEPLRDDENYSYVAAWEYTGEDISKERLHKEPLVFEFVEVKHRSYK